MGCYQIVIKDDNGRHAMLPFLCWFVTLIVAQKAWKCNHIPPRIIKLFNAFEKHQFSDSAILTTMIICVTFTLQNKYIGWDTMDTKKYEDLAKILDAAPDQETKDRIMSKVVADPDIRLDDDDLDTLKKYHG